MISVFLLYLPQEQKSFKDSCISFSLAKFVILRNLATTISAISATPFSFFTGHLNRENDFVNLIKIQQFKCS